MLNNYAKMLSKILIDNNYTLSIAESFTGGLISSSLINIEGASKFLNEGIVAYSNEAKIKRLNVNPSIINEYGAVSSQTAQAMIEGLREFFNSDFFIATTGNAGPTAEKEGEEGKYFIAVGDKKDLIVKQFYYKGVRQSVINDGVKNALQMMTQFIEKKL